ncbi:MAG: hypothetical protein V4706_17190 [Pseudomonadota bacterium]
MCPDRNVINCFMHYNGFVVVAVLICIVIIYVALSDSDSASDKPPGEGLSAGTEASMQANNGHARADQSPPSAPPNGLSMFKLAVLSSPVWAPALLALLASLLPAGPATGLIMFTLFILPLWGAAAVLSLRTESTASAFLVAIAYYVAAFVVTFIVGGIVLVLTGEGLY